ncbi:hypothetical protein P1J78_16000 [Psychromarinibacter sp. C21-152]|uniref:Uncharacterized protein n=1 Tax=Psychromarinibacter sediminicola TaxID=3033385 RepID=A0AAE3T9W4_9RHOB|nr:hypothetical protein [Psychromarinibacter sediminicola]MDF0602243.1 hypothetical protein [Psychromarinibacter sediminicola]
MADHSKLDGPIESARTGRLPAAIALTVLTGAAAVLVLGWLARAGPFVRPAPEAAAMVPLTALGLAGIAAALLLRQAQPGPAQGLAAAVGALAALNLAVILFGQPLGLGAYLPLDRLPDDRMAPPTSLALVLLALSVPALVARNAVAAMALSVFGLSATACMTLLTLDSLGGTVPFPAFAGLSLYTALCLLALFTVVALEA